MTALPAFQGAVEPDTVVGIVARDGYDLLQALVAVSIAAALFGVLLLLAVGILQMRQAGRAVEGVRRSFVTDPGVEGLRRTVSHVESISRTLEEEVGRLSQSVSGLSDRLIQASDRMEERIEEFNALMELVQREAEGAFVEGAAVARGVRAGLTKLSERDERPASGAHSSETSDGGEHSPETSEGEDVGGNGVEPTVERGN